MCIPWGLSEMMLDLSMKTKLAPALPKHAHIISLEGSCFLLESLFRTWQGFFPLPVLAQSVLYVGLAASTGFYLMTWTEKNSLDSLPVRSDFHNTDQMNSQSPQGRQIRVNRDTCKIGSKVLLSEAAAALLQSCPTLCDTIDGSPPGSPVPGTLQARTLEWGAISFSHAWKEKWKWGLSVMSDS